MTISPSLFFIFLYSVVIAGDFLSCYYADTKINECKI